MTAQMFNFNLWISDVDKFKLRDKFNKILTDSNFGIISFVEYSFSPYGYTALWLLSESHFAIHTFPEHNKTYIELSSCVEKPFNDFRLLLGKENFDIL